MKPIFLALFEFYLSNGTRKELFGIYFSGSYLNTLGVIFDAFLSCSFRFEPLRRIRSYLWTRRQATNPISNLVELRKYFDCWINICCTSHAILHFKLLHSFVLLICATLTFPRQWPVVPPQSKEWGNYYNCASRACGALFASFFFAEVRSGRMSSYDPRSWGHSPKELFALSLRKIWLA